jgi:putative glycosyltransferase (TIGR04372 family)
MTTIRQIAADSIATLQKPGPTPAREAAFRRFFLLWLTHPQSVAAMAATWLTREPMPARTGRLVYGYLLHVLHTEESRAANFAVLEILRRAGGHPGPALFPLPGRPRTRDSDGIASLVAAVTDPTAGSVAAGSVAAGSVDWPSWRITCIVCGNAYRRLLAAGRRDLADRLFILWGDLEDRARRDSRALVLHPDFFLNIGHGAIVLALSLGQRLGWMPERPLLAIEEPDAHNPTLRQLLAPHVSRGSTADMRDGKCMVETVHGYKPYRFADGRLVGTPEFLASVFHRWTIETGTPPLPAPEGGDALLRAAGVDPDRPFVTLHVREPGFNRNSRIATLNRNADPATYLPAIDRLIAQGYQVVRMGDASMAPLPPRQGLVDYARSSAKRPDLDMALVATCGFHIGTSSGLSLMPVLFDRPVLFTNWLPLGDEVWSRRSLFLFKRVYSFADGPLDAETARRRFSALFTPDDMTAAGGYPVNNTPAEITAAVEQMLAFVQAGADHGDVDGPITVAGQTSPPVGPESRRG